MSDIWTDEDIRPIAGYTPEEFTSWLLDGLKLWEDPQKTYLAFRPVSDRFTIDYDLEPQIADMFERLPEGAKVNFLRTVARVFRSTSDYGEFDFLQNLTGMIGRPEPLESMVSRLRNTDFLEKASPEVAKHLCAKGIRVVANFSDELDSMQRLVSRLRRSPHLSEEGCQPDMFFIAPSNRTKFFILRPLCVECG